MKDEIRTHLILLHNLGGHVLSPSYKRIKHTICDQ